MKKYDVFISHSSKNRDLVIRVRDFLENNHITCFDCAQEIIRGDKNDYSVYLDNALKESKILLVIYTKDADASKHVHNEIALAHSLDKFIYPLRFTDQEYSAGNNYFLKSIQFQLVDELNDKSLYELCRNLLQLLNVDVKEKEEIEKKRKEFKINRIKAINGDRNAQLEIAEYYLSQEDTANLKNGIKWLEIASGNGSAEATYELAKKYLEGGIVEVNVEKGIYLLNKIINENSDAKIQLAKCYRDGIGVKKNLGRCNELLIEAADKGSLDALIVLADLYRDGYGFVRDEKTLQEDYHQAFEYDLSAAEKNYSPAYFDLFNAYLKGIGCTQNIQLAKEYLEKAIESEVPEALSAMGELYENGSEILSIEKDIEKSIKFLKQAAKAENILAIQKLSRYYKVGKYVNVDEKKAFDYAKKGALKNDALCQYYLGICYLENGDSLDNDIEAFLNFEKAVLNGEPRAYEGLAKCYYYGLGINQDFLKAKENLVKAIEYGKKNCNFHDYGNALYLLGQCYENGFGCEKNIDRARYYYKESAKYHYENALEAIDKRV